MKKMVLAGLSLMIAGMTSVGAETTAITGAGATFPQPIYSKWASKYQKLSGLNLNYQGEGSGFGIAQIKKSLVDFGATDAPLKEADLTKFGLVQFPMIIGGVVPIVNLKDVKPGQLKLTGAVLADIYLGKITKWNDRALADLNKDMKLPDQDITVVHRSDGSGTTWLFTNYLDKVSKAWHEKVGTDKAVAWPAGIGAKGNPGVANYVKQTPGAIGYVEYSYAVPNKLIHTQMKNKAGQFVAPTNKAFGAAAEGADWQKAAGYHVVLTEQGGKDTWPITGASFILIHKQQPSRDHARAMLKFFDWCYKHGARDAEQNDYVPIPTKVYELVEGTWGKDVTADGKPVWP